MHIYFKVKKLFLWVGIFIFFILFLVISLYFLSPANSANTNKIAFEIKSGESFKTISQNLYSDGLIKSPLFFDAYLFLAGKLSQLKPGIYELNQGMSIKRIATQLTDSMNADVIVTIPEGSDIYDIDNILSKALIIHPHDLINYKTDGNLEGILFPDTYHFFTGSSIADILPKFFDNWNKKVEPLLGFSASDCLLNSDCLKKLTFASIIEKEVQTPEDQKIVAGIMIKRISANMPLDLDATICYMKQVMNPYSTNQCYPLTQLDFKIESPYNSYLNRGLPPTPISNPGVSAISAVLNPESSPYWYYLSDPKTGKTIFAKTLLEQNINRQKYLNL